MRCLLALVACLASGCATDKTVRAALGEQSAMSVQATRIGPVDVVVSRSYIGGHRPIPRAWQSTTTRGALRLRVAEGASAPPETLPAIEATIEYLHRGLGLPPAVGQVEVNVVPERTAVHAVRRSVARRNRATVAFWEEARARPAETVALLVRTIAHEWVHLGLSLNGPRVDGESEERIAHLVEHCAVLNVMTEVNRLPLPTLDEHASSLPRGLSRSLAAQAAIFAELPDVIRANTPAAEVLFQRCRAATRQLATGSSVTATAMWSEPAAGMAR